MSLTDDNKIDNLWKKSRGVVDIEKEAAYYDVAQKPFVENILNKDIFSNEVPDEIPGQLRNVSGFGPISENSVIGLDDIFDASGCPPGGVLSTTPDNEISYKLGTSIQGYKLSSIGYPHLTYYHRIPLIEHPTSNKTKPGQLVKTTWYIPDPTNPELSALRYSINFKKGGFRHYEQRFYAHTTNPNPIEIKEGFSPHLMVFDNKSGYVLLYGDDDSAFNWKITSASTGRTGPLLMSFIRYEGPLGAKGPKSLDASFNNVDISENLISEDTDLIQVATFEIQRPPPGVPPGQALWTQVSIGSRNYNLASADPSPNIYGYYLIAECDEVYGGTVNLGFFEIEVILNQVPRAFGSGDFKFNSKFYLGINGYRKYSSGAGEVIFHAIRSTFDDYKNSPVKKIILVFDKNDEKYKVYIHFDYNIIDYGLTKFQQTGSNDINVVSSWNKLFERNGLDTLDKKLRFQVRITENDSNKMTNYDGLSYNNAWKIKNFDFDNTLPMNEIPGQPSTGTQTSDTLYEYDMFTRLTEEGIRTRNVLVAENELFVQGYNLILKWEKQAPRFPSNWICLVHFTKDPNANFYYDKNYAAANAMVYLRLNYDLNSSGDIFTQEVLFNVSYIWSNNDPLNVKGNINIISQHCSNFPVSLSPTNTIIKSLEIVKDNQNSSNPTKVLLYCQCEYDQNINSNNVECYVEIYNNRDNIIRSTSRPGPANYWAGNSNFGEGYGSLSSYSTIDKVELGNDITSQTITFKSKRLGTNKLILTRDSGFYTSANSNANCPSITENENILHTNYKHTAVKDYSNNLILNAEHGNVIINVKDPDYVEADDGGVQANYGGLKIFNSGPAVNLGNGFIEPPAPMIELVSQNGTGTGLASGINSNGLPYGSAKIYTNSEKNTIIEGAGNNLSFNTGWTERSFDSSSLSFNLRGDTTAKDSRVLLANRNGSTGKIEFTIKSDNLDIGNNRPYIRNINIQNNKVFRYNVVAGHSGYRNTKINSYPDHHGQLTNRAYVQELVIDLSGAGSINNGVGVVDGDWVTIAKTGIFGSDLSGNGVDWECMEKNDFRANAIFEITDRTGSHHHNVKFSADAHFDKASLKVLSNETYSRIRFEAIRIVYADIYDGHVLQIKIRCPNSSQATQSRPYGGNVNLIDIRVWQNTNDSGWVVNERLIEVDNSPTLYLKNIIDASGNQLNPYEGDLYSSRPKQKVCIVDVSQNQVISSTFKEQFMNGVLIKGGLNMTGGDIDMSGGNINDINNIDGIKLIDGNGGNNNILTIRTNSNGFSSINSSATATGYLKFDSPYTMPYNNAAICNASLNNAETATFAYSDDTNTVMYKPDSSNLPNVSNNLILSNTSTMILWDWETLYNGSTPTSYANYNPIFTSSYRERGAFSPYQFAPSHNNPASGGSDLPLLYENFKPVHDGFLTGATFRTAYMSNSNNIPLISIKRAYGFGVTVGASTFELICTVTDANTSSVTGYKIGNLLVGPGPGQAGTGTIQNDYQTGDMPYNFTINPRTTLIKFNKNDAINFRVRWVNKSLFTDTIRVNISDATTGSSTVASVIGYFKYYIDS